MHTINLIFAELSPFHRHATIVHNIKKLLQLDWEVMPVHTYRKGNMGANWLAKYGANHDDRMCIWHQTPLTLLATLLADALGLGFVSS